MAIEDYFKGSSQAYGQLAGSLLAGRRKEDKKEAKRALLASVVMNTFGALQNNQKQTIIDNSNDVRQQYNNIFNQDSSEWTDFADERARVDEYNRMGESAYGNKYAAENMTYSDDAMARGIVWANRFNLPKEVQDSLQDEFNSQRQRSIDEIKILLKDPRVKFRTVQGYTDAGRRAFLAKDNLAKNDPTQRGVIKSLWNNAFKYDKDGNYTGNNAEKIKMDEAIRLAVLDYDNQELQIKAADTRLENFYSSVGGTADDLVFDSINTSQKPYDADTINSQIKVNREVLQEKKNGKYTGNLKKEFFDIPLEIPIVRKDKTSEGQKPIIESIDIKKGQFKNIKVLDANGQVSNLSTDIFYDALAVHQLRQNDMLIQNGSDALIGAQSIHAVLTKWGKEGRFQKLQDKRTGEGLFDGTEQITWNGEDILLVLPSTNGNNLIDNKVQTSDAIATHQTRGEDKTPKVDENGIPEFDAVKLNLYAQDGLDKKWSSLTNFEKDSEINAYIKLYPSNEEEIRKILTNPKLNNNVNFSTNDVDTNEETSSITKKPFFSEERLTETDAKARKEMRQGVKSLLGIQPEQIINRKIKSVTRAIDNINKGKVGSLNSAEFRKWMKETQDMTFTDFNKLNKQDRLPLFESYLETLNNQLSEIQN